MMIQWPLTRLKLASVSHARPMPCRLLQTMDMIQKPRLESSFESHSMYAVKLSFVGAIGGGIG